MSLPAVPKGDDRVPTLRRAPLQAGRKVVGRCKAIMVLDAARHSARETSGQKACGVGPYLLLTQAMNGCTVLTRVVGGHVEPAPCRFSNSLLVFPRYPF